ncbi:hypothetical protein [Geobacter sp. DSM 9736]|uniref:hypothetical protein n=1 Tax=Geobacter sp. DSM 9736 TaxID=1277350 RepID=UPI000B502945|nr:hypothetical protein [Geobacter sp. DSM 9736]SNB45816.1 hypothetical protein SAMN06269301_1245 [Geobacter sp. DSM 9736]
MNWEPITIDEFAEYSRANGMKVELIDGVWWAQVRPFFFRPLFPFSEVDPSVNRYPRGSCIGGIIHAVPSRVSANSQINLLVYDELQSYSFEKLNEKQRWLTKKGLKNFEVRQVTDIMEFVEGAYEPYVEFYHRTRHSYKKERLIKNQFYSWAKILFENPKVLILGVFYQEKLCAIDISLYIEDVIYDDIFFSNNESQKFKITDFILHTKREMAAMTNAKFIFRGLPTGKPSLDESKIIRGCKILQLPGNCRINPLVLQGAKLFMKESYNKLIGLTETPAAACIREPAS